MSCLRKLHSSEPDQSCAFPNIWGVNNNIFEGWEEWKNKDNQSKDYFKISDQ